MKKILMPYRNQEKLSKHVIAMAEQETDELATDIMAGRGLCHNVAKKVNAVVVIDGMETFDNSLSSLVTDFLRKAVDVYMHANEPEGYVEPIPGLAATIDSIFEKEESVGKQMIKDRLMRDNLKHKAKEIMADKIDHGTKHMTSPSSDVSIRRFQYSGSYSVGIAVQRMSRFEFKCSVCYCKGTDEWSDDFAIGILGHRLEVSPFMLVDTGNKILSMDDIFTLAMDVIVDKVVNYEEGSKAIMPYGFFMNMRKTMEPYISSILSEAGSLSVSKSLHRFSRFARVSSTHVSIRKIGSRSTDNFSHLRQWTDELDDVLGKDVQEYEEELNVTQK